MSKTSKKPVGTAKASPPEVPKATALKKSGLRTRVKGHLKASNARSQAKRDGRE
jgi:hypothetical protein